ncbi:MAG TPA: hypothetical protein VLE47_04315 [Candidatus Saccharimonadales bacterium]|nr:hypothetical protein [Candidatus Saccharimonadales bacterium]
MIKALSLLWTLLLSVIVTAVSFFYIRDGVAHGYPFSYAKDSVNPDGTLGYSINYFSVIFDILLWWLLFSLVWLIIKNYVLELD